MHIRREKTAPLSGIATFITASGWLNVYLSVFALYFKVDNMKKEWLALGLLLIFAGLVCVYFSNTSLYQDNYILRASTDNSVNYQRGLPLELSLTANLTEGQRLFFNFTKGRFWGTSYDQANGLEPANTEFAPDTAIEPYKVVEFYLYTPSGDVVLSEVYVVSGSSVFAVVYLNQSADFVPLLGGNLTFANVGIEGRIERAGNYTVKANDIEPYVMKDATHMYNISADSTSGDPPLQMNLWNIETVETKPYFVSLLSAGGVLLLAGVVISAWAGRPKKRRHSQLKKTLT